MNTNDNAFLAKVSNATTPDRTVLVVDEDKESAIFVATVLEKDGYTVLVARDAAEGLALLARYQVGVVISDYQMPGMDGILFLEQVRSNDPSVVRIMLSGEISLVALDSSNHRAAIYQFLSKPVAADTLRTIVRQAFRLWGTRLFPQGFGSGRRTAGTFANPLKFDGWQ